MKIKKLPPDEQIHVFPRRRSGKWVNLLRGMKPGDRILLDLEEGEDITSCRNAILVASLRMELRVITTKVSDRKLLLEMLPS